MAELEPMWRPCIAHLNKCAGPPCETDVQGGAGGMLAHLQIVHFPDQTRERIAKHYQAELEALQ